MGKKTVKRPKRKTYEELVKEWSDENPDSLSDYTEGSHHVARWTCSAGHTWEAAVKTRYFGYGCPYCSGRNAIVGINDLQTVNPALAAEWHPTLNGDLLPSSLKIWSTRKVWWLCKKGHEWESTPANRSDGHGCPYCAGKKGNPDWNLAVIFPELLKEWDYDENPDPPETYTPHSNKIVRWKCALGHSWSSRVNQRTRRDRPNRCPYCAGKLVFAGFNDLASAYPDIACEWDHEKNMLKPDEVTPQSNKKVYWICPVGHSYKAQICNRVQGKGCSVCAGKKPERKQEW